MTEPATISLRQAALEFGPCAGGTAQAFNVLIDRLAEDEALWRDLSGDWRDFKSEYIRDFPPFTDEWLQQYLSLHQQMVPGVDEAFDEFRDEVEAALYKSDRIEMRLDQVQSIWLPDDLQRFTPNASLANPWSFTQALAWIATQDLAVVGAIDHLSGIDKTGWLAVLTSSRCKKCKRLQATPRWQQCTCLTKAFNTLRDHPASQTGSAGTLKLRVSSETGEWKLSKACTQISYDSRLITSLTAPPPNTPKKRGAPKKTERAEHHFHDRRTRGKTCKSVTAEANAILAILKREAGNNNTADLPKKDTVVRLVRRLQRKPPVTNGNAV